MPALKVSVIAHSGVRLTAPKASPLASFPAGSSVFLALLLTLIAASADQLASPILRTTAPVLAPLAFLLFVWRRGQSPLLEADFPGEHSLPVWRLAGFFAMHLALIFLSRSLAPLAQPFSGTATLSGTVVGLGKLTVLSPTLLLLPFQDWKRLIRAYGSEAIVTMLVLAVNVPTRFVEFIWPWYGRMLGWVVYFVARVFVSGLTYQIGPEPTILGPLYDTGLIIDCSGVQAFELLSYVFAFVALLDWNRLQRGRAFLVYLGCLASILICNVFRVAALVVLFNRGYADFASGFHLSAGPLFFCSIFFVYMSLTYRWMTNRPRLAEA